MTFPTLKKGDSNNYVLYLQYGLHIWCYNVNGFDGIFGNGLYNAVINFQKSNNLTPDGIVGQNTWNILSCEIISIQTQLKNKGYNPGSIDGIAGINTYNAVIQFQKDSNLIADGMVGEKSKKILFDSEYDETKQPLLKKGSNDKNATLNLQNLLVKKGYDCRGVDGIFGNGTYNAVISFQRDYNLSVDGIVGPATWATLMSDSGSKSISNNNNNNNINENQICGNVNGPCSNRASEELIYFIKEKEGFAPNLYSDVVNVKTIGYGLTGKYLQGLNNISEKEATQLLTKHINDDYYIPVLNYINSKGVKNPLQREVDAFTSFAYNLGVTSFKNSTLIKKYISGERGKAIQDEFMKWVYAKKKFFQGLYNRRNKEWKIFSGSNENISGYNSKPNISIINSSGKPSGQIVKDNNGYGAKPY